jgi:SAM-dependent methyltransferase
MKLRLLLSEPSDAEKLRFYPLQEYSSWHLTSDPVAAEHLHSELEVCPDFALARALWGDLPRLHVCKNFGILYLIGELQTDVRKLLQNHVLYILASDHQAAADLAEYGFHSIEYLGEFYANRSALKLLVCTHEDLLRAILASAPQAFMHFILDRKGFHLCLGAELWQNHAAAFRTALHFAEKLCKQISNQDMIPFMTAQLCLKEGSGAYGFFADRYDSYMAHVDYDLWFSSLTQWHKIYSRRACRKVLELACGTANVAARFVQAGCEVQACDISAQMLENAYAKQLRPRLYQAALTDPIPESEFDLILCLFDSINYLTSRSQVLICLKEVWAALAEGGLFIFDISTMLNSMQNFSDSCDYIIEPESRLVHEAYYKVGQRQQVSHLSLFKETGAAFSLQEEEHQQKVYRSQELIDLIKETGFTLKAIHSTDNKANYYPKKISGIDHRHYRLFFILAKNESAISK